jgi:hypothetical protein
MGQVLHGSARTTEAVRGAIQHSQASLRVLKTPMQTLLDAMPMTKEKMIAA